jgi:hypothetical protein
MRLNSEILTQSVALGLPTGHGIASAEYPPRPIAIELSAGEYEKELRVPLEGSADGPVYFDLRAVSGEAPWEIEISIISNVLAAMQTGVIEAGKVGPSVDAQGTLFFTADSTWRFLYRKLQEEQGQKTYRIRLVPKNAPDDLTRVLIATLRKVVYCSMWADCNGDITRTTFGDIAYFNTFGGAVSATVDRAEGAPAEGVQVLRTVCAGGRGIPSACGLQVRAMTAGTSTATLSQMLVKEMPRFSAGAIRGFSEYPARAAVRSHSSR